MIFDFYPHEIQTSAWMSTSTPKLPGPRADVAGAAIAGAGWENTMVKERGLQIQQNP